MMAIGIGWGVLCGVAAAGDNGVDKVIGLVIGAVAGVILGFIFCVLDKEYKKFSETIGPSSMFSDFI